MSKSTRNVRKSRSTSFSDGCKNAAQSWNDKVYGIVDPVTKTLKKELRDVCSLIKQADVALARVVREEGDVQNAFNKRAELQKQRRQLYSQLNAN